MRIYQYFLRDIYKLLHILPPIWHHLVTSQSAVSPEYHDATFLSFLENSQESVIISIFFFT